MRRTWHVSARPIPRRFVATRVATDRLFSAKHKAGDQAQQNALGANESRQCEVASLGQAGGAAAGALGRWGVFPRSKQAIEQARCDRTGDNVLPLRINVEAAEQDNNTDQADSNEGCKTEGEKC